ncbi:hypothetical protein DAEQUDRAFT_504228 [Daedalea quercina L-15889]|uniref:Uncharacterized protein n=1 Tax=Daedalea quercina L-15889 TaxID=1314783 RepID=A0A165T7R1_9APHY|nr:hypothetical protein DAEQUDRAFT_504228 [Daedalea quercina L-15889]
MFTRFANPHALDAKTEIVSRNALSVDDVQSSHDAAHDGGLLMELDRLVKRSLGDLNSSESVDEKARKKRRKTEKEHLDESQVKNTELSASIPFRLVSRKLPPKEIELKPMAAPVIIVKEPPCEDNEEEAERRSTRAQEIAVDFDWILKEARKPDAHRHKGLVRARSDLSACPPSVMVVERSKPTPTQPKVSSLRPSLGVQPSPHTFRPEIQVPVVAVTAILEESKQKKTSRNIRRARAKARAAQPRPPAVFWRPLKEWGVRSAGYSVGYEGSWPVFRHDPSRYRYQRDTMRKGVYFTEIGRQ